MLQRLYAVIILSLFLVTNVNAQDVEYADQPYSQRPSYGLFFDLNYNQHAADFMGEEWGVPCCAPRFESGMGLGFQFGGLFSLPVMYNWDLTIRLGLNNFSGVLSKEEPITLPTKDGGSYEGTFLHEIDASLMSVALAPLMSFRATEQISLHLGARLGFMMSSTYAQKEEITDPDWGGFPDTGGRTRHTEEGDIPNASAMELAAVAGLSYSIPLGNSFEWFLEPEVFYSYGLMPISSDVSWNASSLSGGVSIRYAPREVVQPIIPPKDAPLPPMPVPPMPPKFNAFITAVSVEKDGTESSVSKIRVEEFISNRIHPLLNFVFFDDNDSNLPVKYSKMTDDEKAKFSPNYLANLKTMEVYYQVLNIVGSRMRSYPNTTIKLVGCNSNQGAEAGNTTLSRNRAENVKDFLVSEWNIDAERIAIEARNLPEIPSNPTRIQGIQDNRRVEIRTEFNEIIFEPLVIRDTIRETNPPMIRFKPQVSSDIGIKSWKVLTYQGDKPLKEFEGTGQPPAKVELNLEEEQEYVPLLDRDYQYKLIVVDNDNTTWESEVKSLKVEPYTIQNRLLAMMDGEEIDAKDFDQFTLISFQFNKADLTAEHQPILKLAKRRIQDNSKITIEGHTDNTGDAARNQKLSKERADATADGLDVNKRFAKGLGSSNPLYQNDTPEGRFYNRTVYIAIETKIELFDFE